MHHFDPSTEIQDYLVFGEYGDVNPSITDSSIVGEEHRLKSMKVNDWQAMLPVCSNCRGKGKTTHYTFNPFSDKQLKDILYTGLRVPRHYFKGKLRADEFALRAIHRWAKS